VIFITTVWKKPHGITLFAQVSRTGNLFCTATMREILPLGDNKRRAASPQNNK